MKSLLIVGATYVTEENRKKLRALGEHFEVTCATSRGGGAFGLTVSATSGVSEGDGFRLIALPADGAVASGTRYFLRGMRRVLAERPYDIILVESEPWAFIRWQTWWWKRLLQPKALFGEFSWENVERDGLKERALALMYRAAIATDDFVIAGNRGAGDLFTERGLDPARMLVAPQLGVDETLFVPPSPGARLQSRETMGVPEGCFLAGYCGRFAEFKGVLDLLNGIEMARTRNPRLEIHLALMGNGVLRKSLEEMQRTRPWLHLLPPRPHPEVAGFMQGLDLFVLPSRELRAGGVCWKEQFGHVLVEAMACGVATLGSASGAIPEVIGDDAQVFPEGGIDTLAERVAALCEDPALREEIARAGRARVLEHYTHRALSARWAAFLNGCFTQRPV